MGKPEGYLLRQNYPNPFNPNTNIIFSIPNMNYVSLKIYNVLGKDIGTLFEGIKPAGNYQVTFNGNHLASGIYIYKITTDSFSESKKMILLK